jgi:hypothetical protein
MSSSTKKDIERIVEAMDDEPIDDDKAKETVAALGIDVKQMAAGLRAKVAAADAADRKRTFEAAQAAYAAEVERLERRKHEPKRSRDENLLAFRSLLAKVPPERVAMHFLKYEAASDEELEELLRALRHLLGEDESE